MLIRKCLRYRDLKPENLLLAHKPRSSHDIEVKIIDFGLSKVRLFDILYCHVVHESRSLMKKIYSRFQNNCIDKIYDTRSCPTDP